MLFTVDLPQMYTRSKFENSIPSGHLETELKAAHEYFAHIQKSAHTCALACGQTGRVLHKHYFGLQCHAYKRDAHFLFVT